MGKDLNIDLNLDELGPIKKQYFSLQVLARLAVFFETYYILTRQYGINLLHDGFYVVANKAA